MATLGAPKAVSPLIKFCRWGALVAGIGYGSWRYSHLVKKEEGIQAYENKLRAQISEKQAAAQIVKSQEEMTALGKEVGIVPK